MIADNRIPETIADAIHAALGIPVHRDISCTVEEVATPAFRGVGSVVAGKLSQDFPDAIIYISSSGQIIGREIWRREKRGDKMVSGLQTSKGGPEKAMGMQMFAAALHQDEELLQLAVFRFDIRPIAKLPPSPIEQRIFEGLLA